MNRNFLIDSLALIGIFAIAFSILFMGYVFTTDTGLGLFVPNMGGYFWELGQ